MQEARIKAMETIAKRFEEETGTKVNIEVVPWGGQPEKWRTALAAGTLPAAMTTLTDQVMYMYLAGATVPLDDIVDKLGGPSAFTKGALEANIYDGKYIALPHYAHCRILLYRKDLVEAAGYTMPDYPTPQDIIKIATAITDPSKNLYGFVQHFKRGDETSPYWLDIYMKYYGADWFDENGNVIFNSPGTVQAVKDMVTLYKQASIPGALDYGDADIFTLITTGVTAMTMNTGFVLNNIRLENEDMLPNMDVAACPGWMLGVIHNVVFDNEYTDIGKEFVEFLYREDNYFELINTITPGQTPILLKYLADDSPYWQHPSFTGPYADLMKKTARLTAEGIEKGTFPGTTHGLSVSTISVVNSNAIQDMFADIILNGKDVETAVAEAAEKLQDYIDELKASLD